METKRTLITAIIGLICPTLHTSDSLFSSLFFALSRMPRAELDTLYADLTSRTQQIGGK